MSAHAAVSTVLNLVVAMHPDSVLYSLCCIAWF